MCIDVTGVRFDRFSCDFSREMRVTSLYFKANIIILHKQVSWQLYEHQKLASAVKRTERVNPG
jgi:hypothetical protein